MHQIQSQLCQLNHNSPAQNCAEHEQLIFSGCPLNCIGYQAISTNIILVLLLQLNMLIYLSVESSDGLRNFRLVEGIENQECKHNFMHHNDYRSILNIIIIMHYICFWVKCIFFICADALIKCSTRDNTLYYDTNNA